MAVIANRAKVARKPEAVLNRSLCRNSFGFVRRSTLLGQELFGKSIRHFSASGLSSSVRSGKVAELTEEQTDAGRSFGGTVAASGEQRA